MIREFAIFPKYAEAYKRAFMRAINKRVSEGKFVAEKLNTGEKLFKWWIQDPTIEGQIEMKFDNKEGEKDD
jgi:hypothetical protein